MNPQIELTKQRNFAGWETGYFQPKSQRGHATLFAGPEFEKPQVIFDYAHSKAPYRYLFILTPGFYAASVQLNQLAKGQYNMHLSLLKVNQLFIEQVQGEPVAKAEFDVQYMVLQTFKNKAEMRCLNYAEDYVARAGEKARQFMLAAIDKSLAEQQDQSLFWGAPRVTNHTPRQPAEKSWTPQQYEKSLDVQHP